MPQSYRILHVEDDNEYFELFKTQMQRINGKEGWGSLEFVNVASLDDALELFENGSFDLIISDYHVLKGNGIDFLKNVRERDLSIPFIFLTSQGDEQIARDAFIHGANDYFSKQVGLASYEKIFNAMRSQVDLYNSRRRESEVNRKLYQNEELLINLFESISDFLYYKDPEGRYEIVNKAFEEAVGLKKMDIIGRRDEDIFSKKDAKILGDEGKMVMESMEPMTFENNISLGGGRNYYEILMVPITNGHDNKVRLMGIGRNITK
ncbi:MAG TPA: response regulator, partial [Candidatus Methanofastidiosa archaeon]|nr:response regulator [Candidatus Methanofastidiosa archaeon]